ncbi:NAD(P)H-hydrate dehydratase [Tissierella sp.]|uniref:NAD(P)H-hydrate dehydratase n=1 Tax=Tissierella sp. TaxID=41274 RepID=UPI00285F2F70|nr:NAD(P)H-hydrate dehydratase [Tissierella sp.]MDR7856573.1 NAD(P)H-hydrate dehydratase [Tissierella sp.]
MKEKGNLISGIDIVNVNRIRKILSEKRNRFYDKIFTEKEIEYIRNSGHKATTVAGLFAAKEAISKVIGTGIGFVRWKDIEIVHDDNGKPYVNVAGNGNEIMRELCLDSIELSISHEEDYAVAIAIGHVSDSKDSDSINIEEAFRTLLPKRKLDSHKGTYGRVGIIGGSKGMTGAPYLASQAALKTGSGLVYTVVPNLLDPIMSIKLTESIVKSAEDNGKGHFTRDSLSDILRIIEDKDVLGIGPGFGVDDERLYIMEQILINYNKPIVIDADALNCISTNPDILLHNKSIIITPHPGELARLLGKSIEEIQENRIFYSKYASEKYNIIVVLKGLNTIIASPRGDLYVNTTGNPGMATGGSGDLLTGIIASFVGQGLKLYDAARLGVYCHGLAGDLASLDKGEYGVIATDVLEEIPYSIKKIQG